MPQFQDKTVLITGASAGIGAELAREFFSHGAKVWLFARREDRLRELAKSLDPSGQRVSWIAGSVTSPQDLAGAVQKIHDRGEKVDVVIANAGYAVIGTFEKLTEDAYRKQFEVNIFGVLNSIRACLADIKSQAGRVVIISSINGYVSLPGTSAYSMSKFALQGFADSLRLELNRSKASVTTICPGFINTEIRRVDNQGQFHEKSRDPIPLYLQMPAAVAARKIRRATYCRTAERVLTVHGWGIVFLKRHAPCFVRQLLKLFKIRARPEANAASR